MKIFLRFAVVLLCLVCFSNAFSQNTANYTFSTATNASLTDMTGATQIVAAGADDASSTIQTIPFNFLLMGVNYTQFSANSNGFIRLGGTTVATAQYTLGTAATTLISSFGSDELTQTTVGGVFYKVTGSAPNRVLVVEFRNMTVIYDGSGATGDATSQVRLYESTGVVELVYGSISRNSSTGFNSGMEPQYAGFSTGSASGTVATITTSTGTVSTTSATSNQYTLGAPVAELTSAADGSRRIYTFTPGVPANPTNLNFTAVGASTMTLNWTDNATNEISYLVYKSTDGGVNYSLVSTLPAGSTSSVQGGLSPTTTYFWRVIASSEGVLSSPLSGSQATTGAGNIVSNGTGGGLWSAGSTWVGGVPPTSGDNVTISTGDVVTLDQTATILGLTVSGTLQYEVTTARTLNVGLDLNVNFASFLTTGASGSVTTHVLAVTGNIINNGTIDLSIGTAGTVLNFNGASNSTYSGTLGTNDLYSLTLTKSSRAQIVELNLPAFSVRGLSLLATGALLTSNSGTGTLKISGTNVFTGTLWSTASYTIPATLGFWLNNPNFTVNALTGSPTMAGLFRISAGTYNIGTATGNSMGFSGGSVITVEGGAINVTGRFGVGTAGNLITYTQTGGTITVCTIGNTSTTLGSFDLGNGGASSTVSITGGTIIVQTRSTAASGPRDYRNQAGSGIAGVTGGTLQLGNALSGASALAFNIAGVIPNLVITNTTANHTCTLLAAAVYNNVTRNITINTGNTLNLGAVFLFSGSSIVNNGTLTHTTGTSRFITFEPNTNITYSGSGTVTAPMTSLELQNDLNFTIDPASPNIVVTRVIIFSGSFVNANKLTMGNGGATSTTIQLGNTTTPTTGGTFDVAPTFNVGTGGQSISCLRTVNPITLNNVINPTRIINNLTIDPDVNNTVTLAGGNLQVNTALTLTTGYFNLGGNMLTLGSSAASTGTMTGTVTNVINGNFKRWLAASTGTIVFPIGTQITTDRPAHNTVLSNERFYSPSTEEYAGTVGYTVADEKELKSADTKSVVKNDSKVIKGNVNGTTDNSDATTTVTRTASINFTVAPTTGGSLTATWVSSPAGTNGLPLTEGAINITGTSTDGYWSIVAADGLTGGTYDATFTATGIVGVTDFTQLVLLKRANSSSPWTLDGTHVTTTGSNSAPVLSRTGITSGFSEFAVGGDPNPLPVELSSFVSSVNIRDAKLSWSTTSEHNNSGFDIERKANGTETWNKVGYVAGTGNSNSSVSYSFTDRNLNTGKYDYRLKQVDVNGNYKYYNLASFVEIGVPGKFALSQNYPNPFNPTTKINYDLPFDSKVSITLFDMSGKQVSSLVNNASLSAGYYTVTLNGSNLASGIYFYTITAQGTFEKFVSTKKMVLVK